jgi:hypothetical protein
MQLIYDFGISIKEYIALGTENLFPSLSSCPICTARVPLLRHGFYWRYVSGLDYEDRIPICRLKCPSCQRTISFLPACLLPYFQYDFSSIVKALSFWFKEKRTLVSRQLLLFYRKRFKAQFSKLIFFFRDQGSKESLPSEEIEKAIKILDLVCAFPKANTLNEEGLKQINQYFMAH